jgi:hypothetical protein
MRELPGKDAQSDFYFIERAEPEQIADTLVEMVKARIYTGITRGKKLVVLIGQRTALAMGLRNKQTEVVMHCPHIPASKGPRSLERGM